MLLCSQNICPLHLNEAVPGAVLVNNYVWVCSFTNNTQNIHSLKLILQ